MKRSLVLARAATVMFVCFVGYAPAHAANDPAVEYGIVVGNATRVYNAGWQMHICGLRSDRWFDTFKRNMWLNLTAMKEQFASQSKDRNEFERRSQAINLPGPQFPNRATCDRLANSPTAEVVDRAYDFMSGGYR